MQKHYIISKNFLEALTNHVSDCEVFNLAVQTHKQTLLQELQPDENDLYYNTLESIHKVNLKYHSKLKQFLRRLKNFLQAQQAFTG